jgi:hypothetical protein
VGTLQREGQFLRVFHAARSCFQDGGTIATDDDIGIFKVKRVGFQAAAERSAEISMGQSLQGVVVASSGIDSKQA